MPDRKETLLVPQPGQSVEIDEVGSFVRRKGKQAWVWVALSFQTRPVVAMVVGDRSAQTCRKLWERLPEAYRWVLVYTDFPKAYFAVIPPEQHQACKKGSGLSNAVERFNLSLRQRLGRMVRKRLSFSRWWAMPLLCLRLFIGGYNRYCVVRFKIDDPRPLTTA